jgi:hypothetical protein
MHPVPVSSRSGARGDAAGGSVDPADDGLLCRVAGVDRRDRVVPACASAGGVARAACWVAALTPLSVDGMTVAASTTLLTESRSGGRGGLLPWALLVAGSVASPAANVAVAEPTVTGRVIATWPSFSLIAAYELLMRQVRRAADASATRHRRRAPSQLQAGLVPVAGSAPAAARPPRARVDAGAGAGGGLAVAGPGSVQHADEALYVGPADDFVCVALGLHVDNVQAEPVELDQAVQPAVPGPPRCSASPPYPI